MEINKDRLMVKCRICLYEVYNDVPEFKMSREQIETIILERFHCINSMHRSIYNLVIRWENKENEQNENT